MPIKWKFFYYLSILFLVLFSIILIVFIANNVSDLPTNEDLLFFSLTILLFLSIMSTLSFNIFLIKKYFPEKLISTKIRNMIFMATIVDILVVLVLIGVGTIGFEEEFHNKDGVRDIELFIIIEVILLLFIVTILFLILLRLQMNKYLKANNVSSLIEKIGQPE